MRLSLSIAVLIAVLGIAVAGRSESREEAGARARHEQIVLSDAAVCQPALLPAPHPLPPPGGSKQLVNLPAAQGLLPASAIWATHLLAAPRADGRSACLSARATRAPPAVRS